MVDVLVDLRSEPVCVGLVLPPSCVICALRSLVRLFDGTISLGVNKLGILFWKVENWVVDSRAGTAAETSWFGKAFRA